MPFRLDSNIASIFWELTADDDIVCPEVQSGSGNAPYARGFICDDDGTIDVVGKDQVSGASVTIPVIKGYVYWFAIKRLGTVSGPTSVIGFI